MKFRYNRADPCLYYRWTDKGLVMWSSWVDDCLGVGKTEEAVIESKRELASKVKCDDTGEMKEYVGCKVEHNREEQWIKFSQPVLLQSFHDEFELPDDEFTTPAQPMVTLQRTVDGPLLNATQHGTYRKGVGKLLQMMRWSRPDILNATREVSRLMGEANPAHYQAMMRLLKYCVSTAERGLVLKPKGYWDGQDKEYEFNTRGKSDSEHAKDVATRRSVGGHGVYLNEAQIQLTSRMQRIVAISVTEAELIQGCECAQDMLFAYRVLADTGLRVAKPMILEIDNQGAIDIVNNWASSGRTRYMDTKYKFLRELKEANLIRCVWCPTANNEKDVFTKSLHGPAFSKHISRFVGEDKYMTIPEQISKGEAVESVDGTDVF